MEEINNVIVRYGEIGIKGQNRSYFEKYLIKNIKDCLNKNKIVYDRIIRYPGRIMIVTNDKCLCLKKVFGIVSFSPAIKTNNDFEEVKILALKLYTKGSFRISAQRLNKDFNLSSNELNNKLGEYMINKTKAKVNLEKPDCNIGVEVMDHTYLFNETYPGVKGLPVGVEGLVTLDIEDKKDIISGILMMKRGCSLEVINKKNINIDKLFEYSYGKTVNLVDKPSGYSLALVKTMPLKNLKNKIDNKILFSPLIKNEEHIY